MFDRFKNFFYLCNKPPYKKNIEQNQVPLSKSLKKNISYFKNEFHESADLTIRNIKIGNICAAIITIEGMINKEILASSVINPIMWGEYPRDSPIEK